MGDELSDIGDLVFSIFISYIGALELLFVARHLYHWSFSHASRNKTDTSQESLKQLQDTMRAQLAEAESREAAGDAVGVKAMKDGVFYKDGFRIEPKQTNDRDVNLDEFVNKRQKELEEEFERQRMIQEETRQQLEKAELELEQQRKKAAEEEASQNSRRLEEAERAREEEQKHLEFEREAAENARRMLEAERAHEEEQKHLELEREAAENARRMLEAERAHEEEQKRLESEKEAAENARRILEAERDREEEQKRREAEEEEAAENARRVFEAERAHEEEQKRREAEEEAAENARNILEVDKEYQEDIVEEENASSISDLESLIVPEDNLDALTAILNRKETEASEQFLSEEERKRRKLEKQKIIEENARKFLEADKKMLEEMQYRDERLHMRQQSLNLESAPQTPITEEPCLRKFVNPLTGDQDEEEGMGVVERCTVQTVKTQFRQAINDQPYAVKTKSLLFPGVSDEDSSNEPASSPQSSFSTQQSEDIGTGTGSEELLRSTVTSIVYPQVERQEPEGEDNVPSIQYTDDYLRSLDGIKNRPLVREDGSGRRRAFKKRRSSGSSNSSRDSRTSREDELKMFTSLEEEELVRSNCKDAADDFTPIKYTTESTLKVKGHHKRHKRSPAKDMRASDDNIRSSLEMLGEETTNPWGEVVPEHYKDSPFWKREKGLSIDEEDIDQEKSITPVKALDPEKAASKDHAKDLNMPKTSSFEEATHTQNEEAISALQQKHTTTSQELSEDTKTVSNEQEATRNDDNQNT